MLASKRVKQRMLHGPLVQSLLRSWLGGRSEAGSWWSLAQLDPDCHWRL